MLVETLLPLGKVDPGLREPGTSLDICSVYDDAQLVEELGYDALMVEETKEDPYMVMALAAQATSRLGLGTAVAIAFPRSPTVTAMSAWKLQELSAGRFTLGLGSQVRGHIERRFGFRWHPPGPWMREYVQAVRAVWESWQQRTPLNFEGDHYRLNLIVPLFDPGPIDHPNIPIHLAAVNEYMSEVAGEVADGLRPHPVCTAEYIEQIMLPAVERGKRKYQRENSPFSISIKPLIATAADEETLAAKIRDIRARVAFYASTPAYRAAFDMHGLGDLADELKHLSKAQRWAEMPQFISDDILNRYATVGMYNEIAQKLKARYGKLVTNVEFSIPVNNDADASTLKSMLNILRE
ncbi:MAG: TIGR03617 family F420-dependent LLM class oxidoreductase [Gammaproteobacteria bacterium]